MSQAKQQQLSPTNIINFFRILEQHYCNIWPFIMRLVRKDDHCIQGYDTFLNIFDIFPFVDEVLVEICLYLFVSFKEAPDDLLAGE